MSNEAVTTIQPLAPPTNGVTVTIARSTDSKSVADLHNEKHNKIAADALAAKPPNAHRSLKEADSPRSVPEAKPASNLKAVASNALPPLPAHFPAAPLAAAQDDFKMLPTELVVPSRSNPRKHFDEAYIAELAESIRAVGVQTPIRVRPITATAAHISVKSGGPKLGEQIYEIVAGECRYRASLKAGATSIPAVVRAMNDEQALEAQIVENLQRKDVAPIEESRGFAALLQQMEKQRKAAGDKPTRQALIAALAERLGKSVRHVYARLKLSELTPKVLEALEQGLIEASHADELVRLTPEDQKKCLHEILIEGRQYGVGAGIVGAASVRYLKDFIAKEIHRDLAKAPWKKDDAALVKAAGACNACDKRTGAHPELHPDAKGDHCLDGGCYDAKTKAFVEITIKNTAVEAKAAAEQKSVAGVDATKEFKKAVAKPRDINVLRISMGEQYRTTLSGPEKAHTLFKGASYETPGFVECKADACEFASPAVIVEGPAIGQRRVVCAVRECKVHFKRNAGGYDGGVRSKPTLKERQATRRKNAMDAAKLEAKHEIARKVIEAAPAQPSLNQMRQIAIEMANLIGHDARRAVSDVLKLTPPKGKIGTFDFGKAIESKLRELKTTSEVFGVMLVCGVATELQFDQSYFRRGDKELLALAAQFKVDAESIRKRVLTKAEEGLTALESKENARANAKTKPLQTSAAKKTAKAKPAGKAKAAKKGGRR
jgi:ParB/RepB/Spo0J family partition protein